MSVTVNGTDGLTFNDGSSQQTAASGFGFKNRIINGAMMIDQRNAGASVTVLNTGVSGNTWGVDRFVQYATQASKYSVQQNAGSVIPPDGFTNYLGHTSLSAYSVASGDYFFTAQKIEGFNTADLMWGTANAKTVTLSFWVRSSLTGTFGGSISNSALNYSYPFSYSIPVANTWTQINVTISGPTAGTWIGATNGIGMWVVFGLGVGSTYSGTAGAWASAGYLSATGATSVVGTSGATFYITGVQLEKGSTATSFDYRPYGTELALCQRYYWKCLTVDPYGAVASGLIDSTTTIDTCIKLPVTMRSQPTNSFSNLRITDATSSSAVTSIIATRNSYDMLQVYFIASGGSFTLGRCGIVQGNNSTSGYLDASSEL